MVGNCYTAEIKASNSLANAKFVLQYASTAAYSLTFKKNKGMWGKQVTPGQYMSLEAPGERLQTAQGRGVGSY